MDLSRCSALESPGEKVHVKHTHARRQTHTHARACMCTPASHVHVHTRITRAHSTRTHVRVHTHIHITAECTCTRAQRQTHIHITVMSPLQAIAIDEAQFFPDLLEFSLEQAEVHGRDVVVAGLSCDYLRRR